MKSPSPSYRFYSNLVIASRRHIRLPDVEASSLAYVSKILHEMESAPTREEKQQIANKYGTTLPDLRELKQRYEKRVEISNHFTPELLEEKAAEKERVFKLIQVARHKRRNPHAALSSVEGSELRKYDHITKEKFNEYRRDRNKAA